MARGHVVAWSCNAKGNVMVRAHANPVIDTSLYQVEFTGGEITKKLPTLLLSHCMPNAMQV